MGYRVRLGKMPKYARKQYAHLKSYEQAEAFFDAGKHAAYRPAEHIELVELGKYVDYKSEGIEVEEYYNFELADEEFVIVDRKFLLHIIEEYRSNTEQFYENMKQSCIEGEMTVLQQHVENKIREWNKDGYTHHLKTEECTNEEVDGMLTRSWKFEYAVFNLLYILHTFDWANDDLIYSGW